MNTYRTTLRGTKAKGTKNKVVTVKANNLDHAFGLIYRKYEYNNGKYDGKYKVHRAAIKRV